MKPKFSINLKTNQENRLVEFESSYEKAIKKISRLLQMFVSDDDIKNVLSKFSKKHFDHVDIYGRTVFVPKEYIQVANVKFGNVATMHIYGTVNWSDGIRFEYGIDGQCSSNDQKSLEQTICPFSTSRKMPAYYCEISTAIEHAILDNILRFNEIEINILDISKIKSKTKNLETIASGKIQVVID